MITDLAAEYAVKDPCRALQVWRSGYYQWCRRAPGPRARANEQLLKDLQAAYTQSRQTYGSPRLTRQLSRIWRIGVNE